MQPRHGAAKYGRVYFKPRWSGHAARVNDCGMRLVGGGTDRQNEMTFPWLIRRTPGHTLHLAQRGRARAPCFSRDRDRVAYLGGLAECAGASGCAVHAYVLMSNHVHLLLTPSRADGVAVLLRELCGHYGSYIAETYGHAAPLWDERVEVRLVFPRRYVLGCMRYIELNPVHAGLAPSPEEYRWSSYGANATGLADPVVTPHAFYYALGRTQGARQAAYRALFQGAVLRQVRAAYRLHISEHPEPDAA
jgi:putative transposase